MTKQLEDYIKLKGVSEKFNEVANSITEDEIKSVIIDSIKERIDESISDLYFLEEIQEIVDDWISSNSFTIEQMIKSSLTNKLK